MHAMEYDRCPGTMIAGLRLGADVVTDIAQDRSGTAIMAYAFLAGLVALAATVSFHTIGTAVGGMYDVIATTVVDSMP